MKKHNNLLVNSKKLALLVLLSISLSACGRAKENAEKEPNQQYNVVQDNVAQDSVKTQRQKDKKNLLWFVPVIMLGAAAGVGFTAGEKSRHR